MQNELHRVQTELHFMQNAQTNPEQSFDGLFLPLVRVGLGWGLGELSNSCMQLKNIYAINNFLLFWVHYSLLIFSFHSLIRSIP